jgi:hypothetical protein
VLSTMAPKGTGESVKKERSVNRAKSAIRVSSVILDAKLTSFAIGAASLSSFYSREDCRMRRQPQMYADKRQAARMLATNGSASARLRRARLRIDGFLGAPPFLVAAGRGSGGALPRFRLRQAYGATGSEAKRREALKDLSLGSNVVGRGSRKTKRFHRRESTHTNYLIRLGL